MLDRRVLTHPHAPGCRALACRSAHQCRCQAGCRCVQPSPVSPTLSTLALTLLHSAAHIEQSWDVCVLGVEPACAQQPLQAYILWVFCPTDTRSVT